jgi:hypothetical protein
MPCYRANSRQNPIDQIYLIQWKEGVEKKTDNDLREKMKTELICEEELNVECKHGNFVK